MIACFSTTLSIPVIRGKYNLIPYPFLHEWRRELNKVRFYTIPLSLANETTELQQSHPGLSAAPLSFLSSCIYPYYSQCGMHLPVSFSAITVHFQYSYPNTY